MILLFCKFFRNAWDRTLTNQSQRQKSVHLGRKGLKECIFDLSNSKNTPKHKKQIYGLLSD